MNLHLDDSDILEATLDGAASLSAEQRSHVDGCAVCQRRMQLAAQLVVPVSAPVPVPLAITARTHASSDALQASALRLAASIDRLERYTPYAGLLGDVLEVPRSDARRFLHTLDDEALWEQGWIVGSQHRFIDLKGDALKESQAMVFRLGPGAMVPEHVHRGEERCLVLDGQLLEGGVLHHAGALITAADSSVHAMWVPADATCTCVIVNVGYIELTGNLPDHEPAVAAASPAVASTSPDGPDGS